MEKKKSEGTEVFIPLYTEKFLSIVLFGPPGSGKGTLAKFLSSAGSHFHLSSGDIFRALSPESPAGRLYHSYALQGHLVPDEATIAIWKNYVNGLVATNRYFPDQQYLLLDGIPRTENQAKILDKYIHVRHVIVLEMENVDGLMKRLHRRALIERRHDDVDEKVLRTRLDVYHEETIKALDHYPPALVTRFNADQRPLDVLKDVLVKLSDVLTFKP